MINKPLKGSRDSYLTPLPDEWEVEVFAKQASDLLPDLGFVAKKGIIRNVVEKVVGTREKLQVYGFLPITNVNVFTNDRHRPDTPRHELGGSEKRIPFYFEVETNHPNDFIQN